MFSDLYAIKNQDLPVLAEKLGRAFEGDPICRYVFPEEEPRRQRARHFYELVMRVSFRRGWVFAPSEELEGAACWLPPHREHPGAWQYFLAGALITMLRTGPGAMARIESIGKILDERHRKFAPEPHYYLACLGTAPEHRGRGFAGKLVRPMLELCDREGMPLYLETHNAANPPLYERFGFKTMDESPIPETDMTQWSMLRPPRGKNS